MFCAAAHKKIYKTIIFYKPKIPLYYVNCCMKVSWKLSLGSVERLS